MIIGLTGGIASGKSTVSSFCKERGLPVIDADLIAREVVEPDEDAYNEIVKTFGEDILQHDGTIDRQALGRLVFANEEKRQKLNAIVHPAVRKRMKERLNDYLQRGMETVILDVPLLIESQLTELVDKVLLVYVDQHVQLERLQKRDGFGIEEATQRVESQMPLAEKRALADEVIVNHGTKEETKKQLETILTKWKVK
ncbi:dephospho-CoA kinase [Texcoconibacillus texcoconensis]|uniref:Dephospho-CoA kinase n=1 Tax=Texcoconibacillus texcoconensis TaxID=1095777 RepID=A0A840QMU5_9BACI|nr:dephospho-CoA kinase [Texcoconibacillus texcoconensis]MBB5172712.1 dephospho-CoA kinase [Texcoconibacillus texcoconensis]